LDLLDLVIVAAVAGAMGNGYHRGFTLSALSYGGLVAGTAFGALLAPFVTHAFSPGPTLAPLVGLAMLFLAASVGSSVGYAFGEPLRLRLLRSPNGSRIDSGVGGAFSVVTVLATSWFLGLVFARGPIPVVSRQIQSSAILRAIDAFFPRPPAFLAGVEQLLANVPYPEVFDRLANQQLPGSVNVDPAVAGDRAVRQAARQVVKVRSFGCGGEVFGSAYPVASDYLISNAHVVAGTHGTRAIEPDGTSLPATVVLFDPERDVSILHVSGLGLPVLPHDAPGSRGTQGATIGYPGGGDETVDGAAVRGQVIAEGRDIYGDAEVRREIYVLEASIHPGNSGGPMVNDAGQAIGLVFANSTTDPSEGYALTDAEVAPDISAGVGRTSPVSTQGCAG
jgi:S1-C subfamily serine protease